MMLYHGSNIEIEKIDLMKCKPFKDFGRGFYSTPLKEQAAAMAKRTARIFNEGRPCVTGFFCKYDLDAEFSEKSTSGKFKIKYFNEPNNEWARFVINNRNFNFTDLKNPECNLDNKYDIVIGPVANDDITALINVYLSGILSNDALTRELTFRDLSLQVSFHTEKSIELLKKTGVFYD